MPASPVYKLTPSMLSFLADDCPRCFWLHARGLSRPRMPFPSVFSRYHDLLFHHFLGHCSTRISPELPTGRCLGGELWVESRPLELEDAPARCFLRGRLDHLIQFDDGTWGVIDFKTTDARGPHLARYGRQLHAYAWALERAAPDALHRAPVSRLGLLCLAPQAAVDLVPAERLTVELRPTWIEVERDDEAFARFLARMVRLVAAPDPPPAGAGCSCCRYSDDRRRMARAFARKGR